MIQKKTYNSPEVSIMILEMESMIASTNVERDPTPGNEALIRERNTGSFEENWEQ